MGSHVGERPVAEWPSATQVPEFPGTPAGFGREFRDYYGPTMNAFEAARQQGRAGELERELVELFTSQNRSPTEDKTSIPATFLLVTVLV